MPARLALIAVHTPGEVAPEPLAAAPAEPANLERGASAETASRPPPARRAHLSCQGPAAPPRLTHAGATVAQCLSKLLISPGAAAAAAAAARARWGGGASGAPAKKHLLLSPPPRTHPSATPPTPGPLARSRLPDLSQREVSGFSRKHTRARAATSARVHAPPQSGRPGEPRTLGGRGSATLRLPGAPGSPAQRSHIHWCPRLGTCFQK